MVSDPVRATHIPIMLYLFILQMVCMLVFLVEMGSRKEDLLLVAELYCFGI